jgi:hypothetical protein
MRLFQTIVYMLLLISGKSQVSQNIEFEQSKGKWPFPVSNFTKYKDDGEKKNGFCQIGSRGITFFTPNVDSVKSVFKGKIISIFPVGDGFAIISNYGDYFINYSIIDSPLVKKGESLEKGQYLGCTLKDCSQLFLTLSNRNGKEYDPYKVTQRPNA